MAAAAQILRTRRDMIAFAEKHGLDLAWSGGTLRHGLAARVVGNLLEPTDAWMTAPPGAVYRTELRVEFTEADTGTVLAVANLATLCALASHHGID